MVEVLPLPPKSRPKTMTAAVNPVMECPLRPRSPVQAKTEKAFPSEQKETFTSAAAGGACDTNPSNKNPKPLYCAFFPLKGGCQKGDRCIFSHDIPEAHLRDPSRIIKLPTKCNSEVNSGECRNGAYCPYMHFRAPELYQCESLSAATTTSGRTSSAASSPEQSSREAMIDAPEANYRKNHGKNHDKNNVMDDLNEFPILGMAGFPSAKQKPKPAAEKLAGRFIDRFGGPLGAAADPAAEPKEDPFIYSEWPSQAREGAATVTGSPRDWEAETSQPAKADVVAAMPGNFRPPPGVPRAPGGPPREQWAPGGAYAGARPGYVNQHSSSRLSCAPPPLSSAPPPMWGFQITAVPLPPPQNDVEEALADEDIHFALGCIDDLIADPPAAKEESTVDDASTESQSDTPAAPEDAPLRKTTFLADVNPIADGYLKAFRGEPVIILHSEDDWHYGVIDGDGDRLGWFAKTDVA